MPVSSLKRIIKSEVIKQRIKNAIADGFDNNVVMLDMEGLFKSWDSEIITTIELAAYLKKSGQVSSMSCRKGVYLKTFKKLNKEYLEGKTSDSLEALKHIFIASRGSCFNWISYELQSEHLPVISEAMKLVKKLEKYFKSHPIHKSSRVQVSHCRHALKELAGMVVDVLWVWREYEDRVDGLVEFYEEVNKLQLPPYKWGSSKKVWPALRLSNDLCEQLDKLPIQVKAFYVRSMCLGEWFYVSRSEIKSKIVEEVNQWLYDRGGVENVLYTSISLKKIIALDESVVIP